MDGIAKTAADSIDIPAPIGSAPTPARASLAVVGLGIQWAGQTTLGAQAAIQRADSVLFAVANAWAARWIREQNPRAESLPYPRDGRPRRAIYELMVERILQDLRAGKRVCAVFYGSPTVLAQAAHGAVRRALDEGFAATMLPGVSFLECLFADLGIDLGDQGCQVYEAGDFLIRHRTVDPYAHLVLCQVGMIGNRFTTDMTDEGQVQRTLGLLGERLRSAYPREHKVTLYEAAAHPLARPRVETLPLDALGDARVCEITTLYTPPIGLAPVDQDMLARVVRRSQETSQPHQENTIACPANTGPTSDKKGGVTWTTKRERAQ